MAGLWELLESVGFAGWALPAVLGHLLELVLLRWVLLNTDRSPSAAVAWILAIVFLPVLGPLAYLTFGMNRAESRRAARRRAEATADAELGQTPADAPGVRRPDLPPPGRELARLGEAVGGHPWTAGNRVEVITDTNRTLGLIAQAIEQARETIHLEYYIWQPDKTGRHLRDRLIARARDGVKIRFLYDAFGSMLLRRRFLKPMIDAGIEVAAFAPGNTFWDRWSLNLRSHRKIVVVDGRTAFTGGMNIGDEYIGKRKKFGYWRDTHARLTGPAALQLQRVFADDWFYSTGHLLDDPALMPEPATDGPDTAQIVAGGPVAEPRPFHALMFSAIGAAERSVELTTSYFIPTDPLAMALEAAALRGVDVRILVPGRSAHLMPFTVWAGRAYYGRLLKAGVKIHEYDRGILHAKTLVIDDAWSLVGTPNYDNRSVSLNFEVAVALFGAAAAAGLHEQFERDLRDARPVTHATRERVRPLMRATENFCRLFAPIL